MPAESILRNREAVTGAVRRSQSIAGALRLLGLRPAGGNYRALHLACERFGLEVPSARPRPRNGNALPGGTESRLPGPDGPPSPYKGPALPERHTDPVNGRDWFLPTVAALVISGLAAGSALVLAARDGSAAGLALAAATAGLAVLLAVLAPCVSGTPGL